MSTDTPDTTTDADASPADHDFDFGRFTVHVDGVARRVHDDGDGWQAYEKARLVCERPVRDLDEFLALVGGQENTVRYLLERRDGYELGPHNAGDWDVTVTGRVGAWEDFLLAAEEIDPDQWHGRRGGLDEALSWANNTIRRGVAGPNLALAVAGFHAEAGRHDKARMYIDDYQGALEGADDD